MKKKILFSVALASLVLGSGIVSLSNKAKLNTIQTQPLENVVQMKHLFKLINIYFIEV